MKSLRRAPVLALIVVAAAGCASADDLLVVTGVNVVPMTSDTILANQSVHVRDGVIVAIQPMETTTLPQGAELISAPGAFMIPGLWNMHVHVFGAPLEDDIFPQLLQHGVTGVRDMNGAVTLDSIQRLKEAIATGRVLGPEIKAPGPLVDAPGREPNELTSGIVEVADDVEARAAVRRLANGGADFIKVYNRMSAPLLRAILDEASVLGIPVAGHVPPPLAASSLVGLSSQEHLQGILEESSAAGEAYRRFIGSVSEGTPDAPTIARYVDLRTRMVKEYDAQRGAQLLESLSAAGTAITPTLVSNRGLLLAGANSLLPEDERFQALDANVRESWLQPNPQYMLLDQDTRVEWFDRLQEIVVEADRAGVMVLAGTDLGVPWVYPGSSLHDELELFVRAGMSEYDALATATSNPAEYFGLPDHGRIAVGSVADFVLLEANPIRDIQALRRVAQVFRRGVPVYSRPGS